MIVLFHSTCLAQRLVLYATTLNIRFLWKCVISSVAVTPISFQAITVIIIIISYYSSVLLFCKWKIVGSIFCTEVGAFVKHFLDFPQSILSQAQAEWWLH